jgi:hypothetical protein
MKNSLNTLIIAITILITAMVIANTFKHRHSEGNIINVTGLGKKDFISDLIVWKGSFTRKNMELKGAYIELNNDRNAIKSYLISKGVNDKEIVFSSVNIEKIYDEKIDKNESKTKLFTGYELTQTVTIESLEIDKVETVSREVTDLINNGVELNSETPQYFYSKLSELKIDMIASATQDGRIRAEKIATNAGGKLGKLKFANMGVFQITAQNSSEDFSWQGTNNTASKRKTATITLRLQFQID